MSDVYGIVYVVTNLVNGKQYVGQTIRGMELRWKRHCWTVTLKNCRMPITFAIKKYGKDNFKKDILCECANQAELDEREIYYVNTLNTWSPYGYNLKAGQGTGVMSEETKEKLRKAHTGKKASVETKRRLSIAHMGQKISASEIQRRKDFMKGKCPNQLARENALKARIRTYFLVDPSGCPITVVNMSQFCRDNHISKSKMCEVVRGKRLSCKGYRLNSLFS